VVTNAGGLGILCADACEAAGLTLPELAAETREALASLLPAEASSANPVDLLGSATAATYEAALPLVLNDPGIDSAIVLFVPPVVARAEDVAAAITRAAERTSLDKPLLAVVVSAEGTPPAFQGSTRVAAFPYPESAARTLGLAADRAEWLRRPLGAEPKLASIDAAAARATVESALADGEGWLESPRARGARGIWDPTPPRTNCGYRR
jgi:acyl-CoA synthetase (NDP forming)